VRRAGFISSQIDSLVRSSRILGGCITRSGRALTMKADEEKARASGCDHYVTKPHSPVAHHPRISWREGVRTA
jgi:hypothetical protein